MKAQEKSLSAGRDMGTRHKEKAAHRGTVKHRIVGGSGISVLPDWHSLTMKDAPHQLQPQQEPGLDIAMSSLPNILLSFSHFPHNS